LSVEEMLLLNSREAKNINPITNDKQPVPPCAQVWREREREGFLFIVSASLCVTNMNNFRVKSI
jgi:hypothetical protein